MEFLEIMIVGVGLSAIVEIIKSQFGVNGTKTKVVLIALALLMGAMMYFLSGTTYYQAVLGMLGTASMVYAFIIRD
jgi:hypothetical protein